MFSYLRRLFKKENEMVYMELKVDISRINGSTPPLGSNPKLLLRTIPQVGCQQYAEVEFNGQKVWISKQDLLKAAKGLIG